MAGHLNESTDADDTVLSSLEGAKLSEAQEQANRDRRYGGKNESQTQRDARFGGGDEGQTQRDARFGGGNMSEAQKACVGSIAGAQIVDY